MAWWIMRLPRKQEVSGFNPFVGKNCEAKLVVEMAMSIYLSVQLRQQYGLATAFRSIVGNLLDGTCNTLMNNYFLVLTLTFDISSFKVKYKFVFRSLEKLLTITQTSHAYTPWWALSIHECDPCLWLWPSTFQFCRLRR